MAISTIGTDALAASAVTTTKLASGVPSRSQLPAGTVLQVVQATTTTNVDVSAGSAYTASNLTASITPSSSSNKVLILVNGQMYCNAANGEPQGTIYRNGANIISAGSQFTDTFSSAGAIIANANCVYLDSPATTSSTTYTFYFKNTTAGIGRFPVNGSTASIVLMEIAA